MRLATLRIGGTTQAARIEGPEAVLLEQFPDVGAVFRADALAEAAVFNGPRLSLDEVRFAPVVPQPGKVLCIGMNHRAHIKEMGRSLPSHPTAFAKFVESLVGAGEPILLPPESGQVDWEGEIAVVVGRPLRRADLMEAVAGIGGYTIMCDISMRDWQYRTSQWLQGKTWERSTPLGPWAVTPEELPADPELVTRVNSREMQRGRMSELMLSPAMLLSYFSTFVTLQPGDIVATGTPGGVGYAMNPPTYLRGGDTIEIEVSGIGILRSWVEMEAVSRHD
ncbi:MAG: fumarylacetoacetate hydrolase family protein [Bifidobacteriaceae bacterium]|jgi:acylpyruvate hydrolase|nr:fumarylacetoacetate hydrolase family protein [Bifidobacteriaceae bacterium]